MHSCFIALTGVPDWPRRKLANRSDKNCNPEIVRGSRPEALVFHPFVEPGDIFAIAIEKQRRPSFASSDYLFGRLAPSWLRHFPLDVPPEAILGGLQGFPQAFRALVSEAEAHDRLDGLEAVFPWQGQAQRCAVLR